MNLDFFENALKLAQKRESLPFGELLSAFGKKPAAAIEFSDWTKIVNQFAKNGLGLAPNSFLFMDFPSFDSPMFPYVSNINHLTPPKGKIPHFELGLTISIVGSFILSGAGFDSRTIDKKLWEAVEIFQSPVLKFSQSDKAGLRSNIDYLLLKPPTESFLWDFKSRSPDDALDFIQRACFMFLTSMNMFDPKVASITMKTFDMFDLEKAVGRFQEFLNFQSK